MKFPSHSMTIGCWLVVTSFLHMVNAQAGIQPYVPEARRYVDANICNEKLMLPLTALFYTNVSWTYMCGLTYFDTCRAVFSARCSDNINCSVKIEEYMRWVDAMALVGSKYTCGIGIQKISDALANGGSNCISSSTGREIFRKFITLDIYIWAASGPITCSAMETLINELYVPLKTCNAPDLLGLVQGYFTAVVKSSPCASEMDVSFAHRLTNSIIIILTMTSMVLIASYSHIY